MIGKSRKKEIQQFKDNPSEFFRSQIEWEESSGEYSPFNGIAFDLCFDMDHGGILPIGDEVRLLDAFKAIAFLTQELDACVSRLESAFEYEIQKRDEKIHHLNTRIGKLENKVGRL